MSGLITATRSFSIIITTITCQHHCFILLLLLYCFTSAKPYSRLLPEVTVMIRLNLMTSFHTEINMLI